MQRVKTGIVSERELIRSAAPNPALQDEVQERRSVSTLSKPWALALGASNGLITNIVAHRVIGIVFFLLLVASGAYLYLPLPYTPVPLTLQTFFVLLCAAFLSKKDVLLTLGMYLGLGVAGLPFFSAGQGGLLKLFGPTGGYIVGFIFAGVIVSFFLESCFPKTQGKYLYTAAIMGLGMLSILFSGSLWLFLFFKLSFKEALLLGMVPFIAGDILKVIFAAAIYCRLNGRMRNIFR